MQFKNEVLQIKQKKEGADVPKNDEKMGLYQKLNVFMAQHMNLALVVLVVCIFIFRGVAAAADAETLWTTLTELIGTWVTRLGAVVMFVGGIMFGLGWKNDDAEQKSRGIGTIIAGAIVTALAAMTNVFFA